MPTPSPNQQTIGKNHEAFGIRYDTVETLWQFVSVAVNASSSMSSINGGCLWPVPASCKVLGIEIVSTLATTYTVSAVNVCMGTIAEAGEAQPDNSQGGQTPPTFASNGNCVFSANGAPNDQQVSLTAYTPVWLGVPPPGFDVIWPQGACMTLRYSSASGAAGAIYVNVLGKYFDPIPFRPSSIVNSLGGVAFDPRTDIA